MLLLLCATLVLGTVSAQQLGFGFYDGDQLNSAAYSARLGHLPAAKMGYFSIGADGFAAPDDVRAFTSAIMADFASGTTAPVYLLEPSGGLATCTDAAIAKIVALLVAECVRSGRDIYVRFAPEMNAPWNAWGAEQNPVGYVDAFRRMATALYSAASAAGVRQRVFNLWTPNLHYSGMLFNYAAFFPGADYMDMVGLSCYAPQLSTVMPSGVIAASNLVNRVANGQGGNFYATYSAALNKPMFLETGAAVPVDTAATLAESYKLSWAAQVYGANTLKTWPLYSMAVWLETTEGTRTFSVLQTTSMAAKFVALLPATGIRYGGDLPPPVQSLSVSGSATTSVFASSSSSVPSSTYTPTTTATASSSIGTTVAPTSGVVSPTPVSSTSIASTNSSPSTVVSPTITSVTPNSSSVLYTTPPSGTATVSPTTSIAPTGTSIPSKPPKKCRRRRRRQQQ